MRHEIRASSRIYKFGRRALGFGDKTPARAKRAKKFEKNVVSERATVRFVFIFQNSEKNILICST